MTIKAEVAFETDHFGSGGPTREEAEQAIIARLENMTLSIHGTHLAAWADPVSVRIVRDTDPSSS